MPATPKKAVHAHLEKEDHDRFNDVCDEEGITMTAAVQTFAMRAARDGLPEEFVREARKVKTSRLSRKGTNRAESTA